MLIFKVSVAINLAYIYSIVIKDGLRLFNTMSNLLDAMIQNVYFFLFVFNSSTESQLGTHCPDFCILRNEMIIGFVHVVKCSAFLMRIPNVGKSICSRFDEFSITCAIHPLVNVRIILKVIS